MNKCPFCGWDGVEIVGSPYAGIGRGRCPNCQSNGPEVSPPSAAIHAFTHPAHLMAALHTYDPQTQIVVSREAGKQIKTCVGYYLYDENGHCDSDSRCVDAYRELCAALEVKP